MRRLMFKLRRYFRLKKVRCFLFLIVSYFVVERILSGEKFYFLSFEYPMEDLNEIVMEVESKGYTNKPKLNNVTKLFTFRLDPMKVNHEDDFKDLDMIYVIKSYVCNIGERAAIRNTWARSDTFRMKTVFVLGYIGPLQIMVDEEQRLYKDILQLNMDDNYDNLVYKTIYSMTWLTDNGIDTKYVHLLDDDRLVNTQNLYKFALNNLTPHEMKMIGHEKTFSMPKRNRNSKYYTPVSEYPYDFWPPYLIGGTILTNMVVVRTIAKSFPYTKIIRMEDVLIGILAKLLHIKLEHNDGFLPYYISGKELKNELSSPDNKKFQTIVDGWRQMIS